MYETSATEHESQATVINEEAQRLHRKAKESEALDKAFKNDTKIYRKRKFICESPPSDSRWFYIDLTRYIEPPRFLNLLSRASLGKFEIETELSDKDCQRYIYYVKNECAPRTSPAQAAKIRMRTKQVNEWRQEQSKTEQDIQEWIDWFADRGEWGDIIDDNFREEAANHIKNISNQCRKNFLFRHSFSVGKASMSGCAVLYPGHNPKIVEDLDQAPTIAAPNWAIGSIYYQIDFPRKILHIISINVDSRWRGRGHGYALARYLADFAEEHFSRLIDHLTVDCRNSHSARIFEKVGFKQDLVAPIKDRLLYGATHCRTLESGEWQRGQLIIKAWCQTDYKTRYYQWLTNAMPTLFPDQYHKVGYHYG